MKTLTIGGVPEHFNLPWHLAIEDGKFAKKSIDLKWKEFPGGTGAMNKALRDGSIDIAIILTSGIIKDIIDGNPSKIVKVYVQSPLLWGVHLDANSKFKSVSELENAKAAISRYGSGSQLMALVNAYQQGFDRQKIPYEIVKDIDGAIEALKNGKADYFMWEHFTTKPLVDQGIFKRIKSISTPWPCFVMAVRNEVLDNQSDDIKMIINVINKQLQLFKNPLENGDLIRLFSERYDQKTDDIKEWLAITKWDDKKNISKKLINSIQNKLLQFNVIEKTVNHKILIKKVFKEL
jgi:ABC-type nitrate/sulfonate/bicarbonate transport system substrate-binding protein